jgi:hypothetical protein
LTQLLGEIVIPAQAGIQQRQTSRVADKNNVVCCAVTFNYLDSGLRRNDEASQMNLNLVAIAG